MDAAPVQRGLTGAMSTQAGPTGLSERALGPDLARGFMLLFIALANSHYFVYSDRVFGGFPIDGSAPDRVVGMMISTFVDGRAFPMFGVLFGYGVAQIVRRQREAGKDWWPIRKLLWWRSLVLIVLGFLHAMLLYIGDILAAYGVLLFLGVWALRWKDRWLFIVAAFVLILTSLPSEDSLATSSDAADPAMLPPDFLGQFADRVVVQPFIAGLGWIGFVTPFLIGLWAGRRRILERPAQHLTLLRTTALLGLTIAVAGALPVSLVVGGVLTQPSDHALSILGPLHDATGVFGGFGYAALIVLVARRLGDRQGPVSLAIAAVGQRSLTCYLSQSVVWAVVFTPYLLDLSHTLTTTTTALLAVATWLSTVLLADRMRRADYRGPFEILIRRITYQPKRTAATLSRNSGNRA
ncbi:putative membrane protein YeiB [Kribbella rubisoli]|uniref:Membrane protein YeiB n=2 Tax=Kribbella rubisoli TaxID=3075929 RepID=A0A4V2FX53_9ACTN|nr:putative membrane protein YeiB [Kribbella rubisoli]